MTDTLRVNGNLVSWGSHILTINGLRYTSLTEVSYGDKLETTQGYGMSRSHGPIGRTAGKYVPDNLKMKMYQHAITDIIAMLANISPDGSLGSAVIPITLAYYEVGLPDHMLSFVDCRLVTFTESITESADAPMGELEWTVQRIYRDGTALFRPENSI